jgi:hypothetical protein
MFFQPRTTKESLHGSQPTFITLHLPDGTTTAIMPATSIHYLGVFFTPCLNWLMRVKVMSTRAHSLIKGLGVSGNSI